MSFVLNRRRLLLGGATMAGAALTPGLTGSSLGLIRSAWADMARPSAIIRMSSNENPYGPSKLAIEAMEAAFDKSNLYGGIGGDILKLLSNIEQVPAESIVMSAGSGEILQAAALMVGFEPGSIVAAYPTYEQLTRAAEGLGNEIIRVPVKEDMSVDLDAMYAAIRADTRMVYLCNPNNPIPSIIEKKALEDFVRTVARERLVFVDEAYYEYVANPDYASMMPLVAEGVSNLIIARTASKIHGFAGLRVGFGFAHPDLIARMSQMMTGSVNILAQHAAYASYQDMEFQNFSRAKNRGALDIVEGMYEELGLRYVKSNTNFTFFETGIDIEEFRRAMLEHNIAVGRPFPPYTTWARVSIAKPEEMAYFVQTYKKLYG